MGGRTPSRARPGRAPSGCSRPSASSDPATPASPAALTYGFEYGVGDFDYVKFEFEALKRFDISARTFLIGRMRGGTFPHVGKTDPEALLPRPDPIDFFAVPSSETFRLDGRENLKGLDDSPRGT